MKLKKNKDFLSYIEDNMKDFDEDFFDSEKEFIEELIYNYKKNKRIK